MTPIRFYAIFVCLLYGLMVILYARNFIRGKFDSPLKARALLVASVVSHLVLLAALGFGENHSRLATPAGGLSALALSLTIAYFLIEWISKERNMGIWILPLPAVFQILATIGMSSEATPVDLPPHSMFHIITALIGYCAFSFSAAFSVMYLVLYHELKIHRLQLLFERLPSLETLENMAYRAIHFGLGFLAVSVVLGEWLFYKAEGRLLLADAKIIVAVISCVFYGLVILARSPLSIRGKRLALSSISGFALILFSLFIVDRFLSGFHRFLE